MVGLGGGPAPYITGKPCSYIYEHGGACLDEQETDGSGHLTSAYRVGRDHCSAATLGVTNRNYFTISVNVQLTRREIRAPVSLSGADVSRRQSMLILIIALFTPYSQYPYGGITDDRQ